MLAVKQALRTARFASRARPLSFRPCLSPQHHRYASTQTKPKTTAPPTPPSPEFERLLCSLTPDLAHDDLAKRVAALFLLTDKQNEIEQVEKRLHALLRGLHFKDVAKKIRFYLRNPPEELVKSGYEPQAPAWLTADAQTALSEANITTFDYLSTLMESDPSVKLLTDLDTPTSEAVEHDWLEFKSTKTPEPLERLLQFYSRNGLDLVPPSKDSVNVVKRLRDASLRVDDTPVIPESEILGEEGEGQEDAVVRARNAARDSSLNSFEPPPTEFRFPDLMESNPLLDPKDILDLPPDATNPFHNKVIVRNHRSVFHNYASDSDSDPTSLPKLAESADEFYTALPVSKGYFDSLHQSVLIRRGVVQQTGKGKIRRVSYLVLLGNADGLVGLGEGKHANSMVALKSARIDAIRNMDFVERFEKRTVWTEMRTKLGGTELILRPRPVGFGLRCNPYLHQILRAAGFKDISAKVWGSRNRLNVIKAAFRLLQAGHAPTGMGDGLGGPGKKLAKGSGLVGKKELERARGRKLVPLRK